MPGSFEETNLSKTEKGELEKRAGMRRKLDELHRLRIPMLPLAFVFIALMYLVIKPFEGFIMVSISTIFIAFFAIPSIYFLKKNVNTAAFSKLEGINTIMIIVELSAALILLYYLKPIITYYIGGGSVFFMALVLIIWTMSSEPLLEGKKYLHIIFFFSCSLLIIYGFLEYLGIYPIYSNYPVEKLYFTGRIGSLVLSTVLSLTIISILQFRLHTFWGMFRKQARELKDITEDLDQKVNERTRALEESKAALELRVDERTKELNAKIDELEKFRKLSIGRELKMIDLKKKIKDMGDKDNK